MTAIITRLLLSMIVMLATPVLYTIVCVVMFETRVYQYSEFAFVYGWATAVGGGFLVVAWLAVWRGQVRWTAGRWGWTAAAFLGAWVVGGGAGLGLTAITDEREIGIILGGMIGGLTWLAASTLAWRESKRERAARQVVLGVHALPCPACGYNLAGLHAAACPECGAKYTLDQLFAAVVETKRDLPG